MSTLPPLNIRYPYDPTGRSSTNLVRNEVHTLPPVNNRIIVPRLGAFYAKSLIITHNTKRLELGKDYELAALYHDATVATGQDVNVMIFFKNLDLDGEFELQYQVVGGQFTGVWESIQQYVNVLLVDPRKVRWDDILDKPELYAPKDHFHDINDVYGLNYLVPKMEEIRQAILRIRAREFRKVYDRIFKIKADTEKLIADANDVILNNVLRQVNNTDELNTIKQRITALTDRLVALENNNTVTAALEALRLKDTQLQTSINGINTSLSSKLNTTTFNDFKNSLDSKYIPIKENLGLAGFTNAGTFGGFGTVTTAQLRTLGFELDSDNADTKRDYTMLSLFNPVLADKQHTQLISLGYGEHYFRTHDYSGPVNGKYLVNADGYVNERILTSMNIKDAFPLSTTTGNKLIKKDDGFFVDSSGLQWQDLNDVPVKPWVKDSEVLARRPDGTWYKLGLTNYIYQDVGVAISSDKVSGRITPVEPTATFKFKVAVTNSGNERTAKATLTLQFPTVTSSLRYSTANFTTRKTGTANVLKINDFTYEIHNIAAKEVVEVNFDLIAEGIGTYQVGAQVLTEGSFDTNTLNNHASLTVGTSQVTAISSVLENPEYIATEDCPMIIATNAITGERYKPLLTERHEDGTTWTMDITDKDVPTSVGVLSKIDRYISQVNLVPGNKQISIKFENISSFNIKVFNYINPTNSVYPLGTPDYSKSGIYSIGHDIVKYGIYTIDKTIVQDDLAGFYINAKPINLSDLSLSGGPASGSLTSNSTDKNEYNRILNEMRWNSDTNTLDLTLMGDFYYVINCRPKGNNCVWQSFGFAGYTTNNLFEENKWVGYLDSTLSHNQIPTSNHRVAYSTLASSILAKDVIFYNTSGYGKSIDFRPYSGVGHYTHTTDRYKLSYTVIETPTLPSGLEQLETIKSYINFNDRVYYKICLSGSGDHLMNLIALFNNDLRSPTTTKYNGYALGDEIMTKMSPDIKAAILHYRTMTNRTLTSAFIYLCGITVTRKIIIKHLKNKSSYLLFYANPISNIYSRNGNILLSSGNILSNHTVLSISDRATETDNVYITENGYTLNLEMVDKL